MVELLTKLIHKRVGGIGNEKLYVSGFERYILKGDSEGCNLQLAIDIGIKVYN